MASDTSFDYASLSLILKFSDWLSWHAITGKLQPGDWLDIMPGYRSILQLSQQKNTKIMGFYAIDQALAPELKKYRIHLKQQYIEKTLPYSDQKFDNITLVNGLEHLWYPQAILDECYRVLRPGGRLQIIVPTWFGKPILEFLAFTIKIQDQIYASMNDHKMYYDKKAIWPMIVRSGFKPANIKIKRIKVFCSLYVCATKA